jgi:hypothetical protein
MADGPPRQLRRDVARPEPKLDGSDALEVRRGEPGATVSGNVEDTPGGAAFDLWRRASAT